MRIGGLEKNSLIDFAPRISCVVFTKGCNFACPYCHNPGLVAPGYDTGDYSESEIMDFLGRRRHLLDGVVISGGEPTLQSDLPAFCARLKEMGYAVKLDTNGSFPDVIARLVDDGLIDHVAMDIKTAPERYPEFIAGRIDPGVISSSIAAILKSGLPHEFRTTCVRPIVDRDVIAEIAERVYGARHYALQRMHENTRLNPAFFETHDWQVSEEDLQGFQTILSRSVQHCIIR